MPLLNALATSGLLGVESTDESLPADGIEHYRRYGTQWQTVERFGDMGHRALPNSFYQNPPPTPVKGVQPPDTGTHAMVGSGAVPEDATETDTGWLAQFYLMPNYYLFPNPLDLAMIGSVPLKLDAPRKVRGASLPACLYPEPGGLLAMVSVFGREGRANSRAHRVAYDVAVPILDELAVKYDVSLPIVQTVIVGIPSGLIHFFYRDIRRSRRWTAGKLLNPGVPTQNYSTLRRSTGRAFRPTIRFIVSSCSGRSTRRRSTSGRTGGESISVRRYGSKKRWSPTCLRLEPRTRNSLPSFRWTKRVSKSVAIGG